MTATAKPQATLHKHNIGHFSARHLQCLQPFVEWQRDSGTLTYIDGNLFVEPAAAGGVHITAVTHSALAVIHDPDGYVARACVVDIPAGAFAAAHAPEPVAMTFEGVSYRYELPEWAQPGTVYIYEAGMHITPKMRPPQSAEASSDFYPALFSQGASHREHVVGRDFSMRDRAAPAWRELLTKAQAAPVYAGHQPVAISPALVALFEEVHMRLGESDDGLPRFWFRVAGTSEDPAPIIVTMERHPEFLGLIMPMSFADAAPIPPHFFFPAVSDTEARQ